MTEKIVLAELTDLELDEIADEECIDYICQKDCDCCNIHLAVLERIRRQTVSVKGMAKP